MIGNKIIISYQSLRDHCTINNLIALVYFYINKATLTALPIGKAKSGNEVYIKVYQAHREWELNRYLI